MNGTKLSFNDGGPMFDFSGFVKGFDASVQNALVHTGTDAGSDPLYPDRGTFLIVDGAQGRMVNTVWATHSANFAAMRVLQFCQQIDDKADPDRLQNFRLQLEKFENGFAKLRAQGVSESGEIKGLLLNI
jgi:hypothetical protein